MLVQTSKNTEYNNFHQAEFDKHTPKERRFLDALEPSKREIMAKVNHGRGVGSGHTPLGKVGSQRLTYDKQGRPVWEDR